MNLFLRLLQQKPSLLIATLDEFINSVVAEDSKDSVEKAALVVSKLSDLRDLLASHDRPAWIASFNSVFSAYAAKNYPS